MLYKMVLLATTTAACSNLTDFGICKGAEQGRRFEVSRQTPPSLIPERKLGEDENFETPFGRNVDHRGSCFEPIFWKESFVCSTGATRFIYQTECLHSQVKRWRGSIIFARGCSRVLPFSSQVRAPNRIFLLQAAARAGRLRCNWSITHNYGSVTSKAQSRPDHQRSKPHQQQRWADNE